MFVFMDNKMQTMKIEFDTVWFYLKVNWIS